MAIVKNRHPGRVPDWVSEIHALATASVTQRGPKTIDEKALCFLQHLCIPTLICVTGELPIVDAPPPLSDPGTDCLALELGPTVPIPPAEHGQIPQYALRQR